MKILIRGGRLVVDDHIQTGDLLLEDEHIRALEPAGTIPDSSVDEVIDAADCFVLPGLIDVHTHLDDRIGRFELADTYASGTALAAVNGITTLLAFITQGPNESLGMACDRALATAAGNLHADAGWHLTPARFDGEGWKGIDEALERGFRTYKLYTTYRRAGICSAYDQVEQVFRGLAGKATRVLVHAEDDDILSCADVESLDLSKAISHARARPEAAEVLAVDMLLLLALQCQAPLHVVHVSTIGAAGSIAAMREVLDVSSETCPQYLWLEDEWLDQPQGHRWICSPPLRQDRDLFRNLARRGTFDCFATDHCAFRRQDKDDWDGRDVRTVANGLPGLGALPHLVYALFKQDPDRGMRELARTLSFNPARLMGLTRKGRLAPGLDADLVLVDPFGVDQPIRSSRADVHEPYLQFSSPLAFRKVFLRGRAVAADGVLLDPGTRPGRPLMGT